MKLFDARASARSQSGLTMGKNLCAEGEKVCAGAPAPEPKCPPGLLAFPSEQAGILGTAIRPF